MESGWAADALTRYPDVTMSAQAKAPAVMPKMMLRQVAADGEQDRGDPGFERPALAGMASIGFARHGAPPFRFR